MIEDLIRKCRSYRRFKEDEGLTSADLRKLIDLARLAGSARNAQPLRYLLVTSKEYRELLFPLLGWAGYLSEWSGPEAGERPAAYIVCLADRRINGDPAFDLGIASQNILLGATAAGLGGCRIGSFSKSAVKKIFDLDDDHDPILVIALGRPAEEVVIEGTDDPEEIRYWRDREEVHHVPKVNVSALVLGEF